MERISREAKILEMPAGWGLDKLVAEEVMGWHIRVSSWVDSQGRWMGYIDDGFPPIEGWHPSTDIQAAWEVVEFFVDEYSCIFSVRKIARKYQLPPTFQATSIPYAFFFPLSSRDTLRGHSIPFPYTIEQDSFPQG